jgi:hypothetical protein
VYLRKRWRPSPDRTMDNVQGPSNCLIHHRLNPSYCTSNELSARLVLKKKGSGRGGCM